MNNFPVLQLSLKKLPILLFLLILALNMSAQTADQIKADRQTYIWGEGKASSLKAADQLALSDIISQISTQVESDFVRVIEESGDQFNQKVKDVLRTYSSATLNSTERMLIRDEPDNAVVLRYIKRSELAKVFEGRKQKISEFAKIGEESLANAQVADALRYFYWSQTLLRSHPSINEVKMTTADGQTVQLVSWLPATISAVFTNLSVNVEKKQQNGSFTEYLLDIRYKNQPVRNLDYSYWTGRDWSNTFSAKEGMGLVEVPSAYNEPNLRLRIEYVFDGDAAADMELRDVMQQLPVVAYRNSEMQVTTAGRTVATSSAATRPASITANPNLSQSKLASTGLGTVLTPHQSFATGLGTVTALEDVKAYQSVLSPVLKAIASRNYESVRDLFTPGGYSILQQLLQYGNAKIMKSGEIKYFQHGEMVIARSVPMSFSFSSNKRTFVEDVVFTFTKEIKINNISFGLSRSSVNDIASNDNLSEAIRIELVNFLENYKTAYALKRLDYIEKIFSDEALIITGSVVKVKPNPELQSNGNPIVRYNRQSKQQYLRNLQQSFRSNEFVNIRFVDNTVRSSATSHDVYGIQIRQDYFSSTYGDSGYLFLLVDLKDVTAPVIHVRTWQPQKNPDGSIYGLQDFSGF